METSIFMQALGTSPEIRVLDLLITGRDTDYSISDICESAEVSWGTIHKVLPKLVKTGLIKQTRVIGRAKLFQINQDNFISKALIKLFDELILKSSEQELVVKAI